MTGLEAVLLAGAAAGAGALNAVAGGGTFLTFPTLLFFGVEAIRANATSTFSLWPGGVASAYAYRRQLPAERGELKGLVGVSLLGGGVGAVLLLLTPTVTFTRLIPFLLLTATLLFTFNQHLQQLVRGRGAGAVAAAPKRGVLLAIQFAVSIYGGYFGAGVGIVMLAAFSLMQLEGIHQMNAMKTLLNAAMNFVALLLFVVAGAVDFGRGAVMLVAATLGGYLGAAIAQRLPAKGVRSFVVVTAWGMTAYFFIKTFVLHPG